MPGIKKIADRQRYTAHTTACLHSLPESSVAAGGFIVDVETADVVSVICTTQTNSKHDCHVVVTLM